MSEEDDFGEDGRGRPDDRRVPPHMQAWLRRMAAERNFMHTGQPEHAAHPRSVESELKGLMGEMSFARRYGQAPDLRQLEGGGDDGIDFVLPVAFTLDVKTSEEASIRHLLVEANNVKADLYIQAAYVDDSIWPKLLGWTWAAPVRRAEIKDFGTGPHHALPIGKLEDMADLGRRLLWRRFDRIP